jgi:cellulose synthase/poly-beta-1,6-N-acetylglucosamine synthase-like glycosyltransferase
MWIFLFAALGCVFLLLALHPFISYPLSLSILARRVSQPIPEERTYAPTITICTCAYNEASVIEAKIQNLLTLKARNPGLRVALYVDGSSDGTAEIVSRFADRIDTNISSNRHGKTHGMNRLVANSDSDLLVFTDANVLLADDAIERMALHFRDPEVGCVCGNLIYTNSEDSVTAATGSLYWRLEQFIKKKESRLGAVMGADGSIFAIRRSLHRPPPDHIIDDMFVSFQVLCAGSKVIQVDDVRAFEKSVSAAPEELRRKIRIACQAFNVHCLIWQDLRKSFDARRMYMYISHKLLRWFSIYFVGLAFLSILLSLTVAHLFWVALAISIAGVGMFYAGLRWKIPVLSPAVDILTALYGAGAGVFQSLMGEQYQTWQPASSIRSQ